MKEQSYIAWLACCNQYSTYWNHSIHKIQESYEVFNLLKLRQCKIYFNFLEKASHTYQPQLHRLLLMKKSVDGGGAILKEPNPDCSA
jgi:hypothetical protein